MKRSAFLLIAVIMAALCVRLLFFLAVANHNVINFFQPDSYSYWQLGTNLARNHVFSSSIAAPFIPEAFRTPGYPFFLASLQMANIGVAGTILVQIFLSVFICLLAMLLAYDLSDGSIFAAAAAGFLMAIDIPSAAFTNTLLTETLFTSFLIVGVIAGIKYLESKAPLLLIPSGISFGICTLCRPIGFMLPCFLSAALLIIAAAGYARARNAAAFRRSVAAVALFLLAFTATLSPWLLRNKQVFGFPFLSTIGYDNFLYLQAGAVVSVAENIPYQDAQKRIKEDFERRFGGLTSLRSILKAKSVMASEILTAHPFIYARNSCIGIAKTLFSPLRSDLDVMLGLNSIPTTIQTWGGEQSTGAIKRFVRSTSALTAFLCIFQIIFLGVLYVLFVRGILFGLKGLHAAEVFFVTAVVVYFCLVSGAPESYARFRVPFMPFLSIIAALGLPKKISL